MAGIQILFQQRSWTIISAAIVLAVGSWGLYAWRHMKSDHTGPVVESARSTVKGKTDSGPTPLRATRPVVAPATDDHDKSIEERAEVIEQLPAVSANTPPAGATPVEITLVRPEVVGPPTESQVEVVATDPLARARAAIARGELIQARGLFAAALQQNPSTAEEAEARSELIRLGRVLTFSRVTNASDPLTAVHEVAPGETLYAIGRQYMVSEELLAQLNEITEPHRLRAGQKIKVIRGPFHAVISKTHHRMDVFLGEIFVRSYRVGLGVNGGTPLGTWAVHTKLTNPDWTDPVTHQHYLADDPDNPIGERWLGLEGLTGESVGRTGFGIHGTIEPESIGQNMSLGCVRLVPEDVAAVYELLVERHSRVTVVQ